MGLQPFSVFNSCSCSDMQVMQRIVIRGNDPISLPLTRDAVLQVPEVLYLHSAGASSCVAGVCVCVPIILL